MTWAEWLKEYNCYPDGPEKLAELAEEISDKPELLAAAREYRAALARFTDLLEAEGYENG